MSHLPPLSHHPLIVNLFKSNPLSALFITKKETIQALTGLVSVHPTEREAFLLVKPNQALLCHTPFVHAKTSPQFANYALSSNKNLQTVIKSFFATAHTIGIEKKDIAVSEWEKLQITLPHADFTNIDAHLEHCRQFKSKQEIAYLKKAGQITAASVNHIKTQLFANPPIGITERQLAQKIENCMIELGADDIAFPTIVAFNSHSAKPHHKPTNTKLKQNSIVLIDCGASYKGYCSDMTRTFYIGNKAPTKFTKIETIVQTAYQAAVAVAKGTSPTAAAIDTAARRLITNAGHGKQYIHSTGHGIGLEAHELPHISQKDTTPIAPHMAFTIEPGIYLEGKLGYRHENSFLTTDKKLINLTKLSNESS